ncbi:predicted protein [Naegleria gruberi]|uniref:Predicted protein n=1 Tax=Naegleria gruberi TaxID=5762 RepID=D2V7G8_NAEGR|nr:uncharacterized protein NAEGRDRAFT_64797 [Naegleria gruberi]EFC47376.1 predicted protein [Naegleria gruberi]|eukprot:XP_002680120.1 predicted protein [Naegleria gruberi strain NEG-M]
MRVSDHTLIKEKQVKIMEYFMYGCCSAEQNCTTKSFTLMVHGNGCTGSLFKPHHEMAMRNGICLIAPTIQGWGLSLSSDAVTVSEFATLMKQLMIDELKIEKFNVIGVSMGGPYAGGVAAYLNKHVHNVNLFVPFGKRDDENEPFGNLTMLNRIAFEMLMSPLTNDLLVDLILLPSLLEDPTKTFESMYPKEFAEVKDAPEGTQLIEELKRSIQWTRIGMKRSSATLLKASWGIELDEIAKVSGRVTITMAELDSMIAPNNPKHYFKKISQAAINAGLDQDSKVKMVVLKGRTHFTSVFHLEEAIIELNKI